MGSNPRPNNMDGTEMTATSSSQQHNNGTSVSQVQVANHSTMLQMPNSANNSIQLTLPNSVSSGTVQLRGSTRNMPHVVYIQTPTGLKPVTSTDVISQASTSGNPPQIIVRRPVSDALILTKNCFTTNTCYIWQLKISINHTVLNYLLNSNY